MYGFGGGNSLDVFELLGHAWILLGIQGCSCDFLAFDRTPVSQIPATTYHRRLLKGGLTHVGLVWGLPRLKKVK